MPGPDAQKQKADRPWTKQELTVYKHPLLALAKAVVRQWVLDGSPARDKEQIKYWEGIIKQCESQRQS